MADEDLSKVLFNAFEKIIKINFVSGTFQEVEEGRKTPIDYTGVDQWFIEFANSSKMCAYDKTRFLKFANIENFKRVLSKSHDAGIVYQRKIDDDYHWAMMRVYKINETEALLTVKDIQQCWLSVEEQENRGEFKTREMLIKDLQKLADIVVSIGMVIFEYASKDAIEMAEVFAYYFDVNKVYQYDGNHVIVIFEDVRHDRFRGRLSQIYNDCSAYNVSIGSVWRPRVDDYAELMGALSFNLQINKPQGQAE